MIFVIDIGNTHTVAGVFRHQKLSRRWRINTDSRMTADELAISYHNLFFISATDMSEISGVIFSSVVPHLDAAYVSAFSTLFPSVPPAHIYRVDHTTVSCLIDIRLDTPSEVGADRLVNGIAAYRRFKTPCIIIDFGTAITFDCISSQGDYLGGLILPGLNIALQALFEKTAKLPQIDISIPPETVIGTSTVAAMKSGVMNGYGSMIEGLIQKIVVEMKDVAAEDITIIATGGMAPLLKPYSPSIQKVEPDLTLNGLFYIFSALNHR
ncbi:MAG: type III pantothenate kinase [Desulfocapsaceae bacterium]|jgi:type III pantothenate kinase|nr:type III pantothenate kinase [Desulfocapsaceae bacterium]